MLEQELDSVLTTVTGLSAKRAFGRVSAVDAGLVHATGLSGLVKHGERVCIECANSASIEGEVLRLTKDVLSILPGDAPDGIAIGDRVFPGVSQGIAPCSSWVGRVIDPNGAPLDGRALPVGEAELPLRAAPPPAGARAGLGQRLDTGLCAFNTFLPIVSGQRVGLFAGSGVGKSSLLAHFARRMEADVVVIALIGERGREVMEFVNDVLGAEGLKRSIVVVATSDQPALMRRRCAWTAMSVAEHFRDSGKHVLFLADSLTRFAEAHREVAIAGGELPAMRGFPPSLAHELMTLCERAGPGPAGGGAITAVLSVLVAGSDMEEPVADILRGTLDGHVILSREIAERGRFPAVDLLKSVSRALPRAASEEENKLLLNARRLLGTYAQSQIMIDAGLYEAGKNPVLDEAVSRQADLDEFLGAHEERGVESSYDKLRLFLRK